ncbi:MAG: hypothetical protein M3Z09_01675 [Acidobacteriota bacterium]|nr:hypothetical protein [Acidobacteriota bacterium]
MRSVFLTALLAIPAAADMHEVVKTTFAGHETVYARYTQGVKMRTETLGPGGAWRIGFIQNERAVYRFDPQRREYIENAREGPSLILTLALWIARPPRIHESGKTVDIYYETIDTGETRWMFGQTARHLIIRERSVAEPGACRQTRQRERDGWFIAPAGTRAEAYTYVLGIGATCRDTVVKHGKPPMPGIAVYESDGQMTRETVELSHERLDNRLFEAPDGFKKVTAFAGDKAVSWPERLGMEFSELGRAFESWF